MFKLIRKAYLVASNILNNFMVLAQIRIENDRTIETELKTPYGLYTNPPDDTECIVLNIDNNANNSVSFACNETIRNESKGTSALVNNSDSYIRIKPNGDIDIYCSGTLNMSAKNGITIDTENGTISLCKNATLGVARKTDTVSQTNITGGSTKVFCG